MNKKIYYNKAPPKKKTPCSTGEEIKKTVGWSAQFSFLHFVAKINREKLITLDVFFLASLAIFHSNVYPKYS